MEHLRRYYRAQSLIYDVTRWAFLFGRARLIRELVKIQPCPRHVVEIGCGTGYNLVRFATLFPEARITGVDLSEEMLALAQKKTSRFRERVVLEQRVQEGDLQASYDVAVFSYSLSMMNPGWDQVLAGAVDGLEPHGILAVVDFHESALRLFKGHMACHHVRMDAHLLPALGTLCQPSIRHVQAAYGGLWKYFLFIGHKVPGFASSYGSR
jgi:S-adenosylmethionine-diacylgycerolhomoserine-N-methlytransferase